jgi:acyl-CoA thioesterase
MGNPFADDTKVALVAPNRYEATIREAWNLRPLPQGGIVTALGLRAMATALDHPEQRLRTLHTAFVAQVASGPVEIEVELLRAGRSMSHLRAEVKNVDAPRGHLTTAIFGSTREGFAFTDLEPPVAVTPPADCPSFRDPPPDEFDFAFEPMPFWDQLVEGRPVLGHAPWDDYVPERAERAMWYRFDESPMLDDGTMDPLAVVVLADTMPGAVGEMIGPTSDRAWFAPSVDLTVHLSPTAAHLGCSPTTERATQATATRRPTWRSGTAGPTARTHRVSSRMRRSCSCSPSAPRLRA